MSDIEFRILELKEQVTHLEVARNDLQMQMQAQLQVKQQAVEKRDASGVTAALDDVTAMADRTPGVPLGYATPDWDSEEETEGGMAAGGDVNGGVGVAAFSSLPRCAGGGQIRGAGAACSLRGVE